MIWQQQYNPFGSDAQSIVVASTATGWFNHEGTSCASSSSTLSRSQPWWECS